MLELTELETKLKSSSKNAFRYPKVVKSMVLLMFAWNTTCMLYFSILLGDLPGGLLNSNFYRGLTSFIDAVFLNDGLNLYIIFIS